MYMYIDETMARLKKKATGTHSWGRRYQNRREICALGGEEEEGTSMRQTCEDLPWPSR